MPVTGRARVVLFVAPAMLALLAGLLFSRRPPAPAVPTPFGTKPDPVHSLLSGPLRTFSLTEVEQKRSSTLYTFSRRAQTLKIELVPDLDRESAEILRKDGVMGLEALYANALSPYPGDISHQVSSDARYRPRFFQKNAGGTTYTYYLLFANERFGYGATTQDAIKFNSLLGWLYCDRDRNFYKVRCFAPIGGDHRELEALFLQLHCP